MASAVEISAVQRDGDTFIVRAKATVYEVRFVQRGNDRGVNDPWAASPAPADVMADKITFGSVWVIFELEGNICAAFRADQVFTVTPNWAIQGTTDRPLDRWQVKVITDKP